MPKIVKVQKAVKTIPTKKYKRGRVRARKVTAQEYFKNTDCSGIHEAIWTPWYECEWVKKLQATP